MSAQYRTEEYLQHEGDTSIRITNKVPIYRWDEEREVMDEIKNRLFDIFVKHMRERKSGS